MLVWACTSRLDWQQSYQREKGGLGGGQGAQVKLLLELGTRQRAEPGCPVFWEHAVNPRWLAGLGRARSRSSVLRASQRRLCTHLKSWNFARHQENRFSPGSRVSHAWWFMTLFWFSRLLQSPAFPRMEYIGFASEKSARNFQRKLTSWGTVFLNEI